MITFETKIREQTVRMYAEVPLKNAAGAIFKTLARISHKTTIFSNKFMLSFGWAYFFLSERTDDKGEKYWVVQTTDYRKNPLKDRTDNVTLSLLVQNMQMEGISVAGVKPEVSTFKDTVLVLKAAKDAADVYMNRTDAAKDGDSGWYFGLLDDPDEETHTSDDYERIPSYALLQIRPEALRVMQMPVGTVAVFHDNDMTALVDADDKPLKFTTKEERQALAAKQDLEFKAQLAEAQKRAAAAAKNSKNAANAPAEAPADSEAEASESTEE